MCVSKVLDIWLFVAIKTSLICIVLATLPHAISNSSKRMFEFDDIETCDSPAHLSVNSTLQDGHNYTTSE